MPLPLEVIAMLFNENAANSSLPIAQDGTVPDWNPAVPADVSQSVAVKS
jgi:hypothetical protein